LKIFKIIFFKTGQKIIFFIFLFKNGTKKRHALSTFVSHEFTNIIKALNINLVAWIFMGVGRHFVLSTLWPRGTMDTSIKVLK
jgi:hypothetical protein